MHEYARGERRMKEILHIIFALDCAREKREFWQLRVSTVARVID